VFDNNYGASITVGGLTTVQRFLAFHLIEGRRNCFWHVNVVVKSFSFSKIRDGRGQPVNSLIIRIEQA
jgi:hypothetical protein